MECSGKREILGEVKKEWMETVEVWKSVEEKEVFAVKKVETMQDLNIYLSNESSFTILYFSSLISCSGKWKSWFIDQDLKSV